MSGYAYYIGCLAQKVAKELDTATKKVCEKLGIELFDFEEFGCCGAGAIADKDFMLNIAINARNFAIAEEKGLNIMVICNTCFLTMREANYRLKTDSKLLEQTNKVLSECGLIYKGTTKIEHFLFILRKFSTLGDYATKPLNAFKVATFYGCQALRPTEFLGEEDPENPSTLEEIIKKMGAIAVYNESRLNCCGFHSFAVKEKPTLKLAADILKDAKLKGANCVVTPSPCCHSILDGYQGKLKKIAGIKFEIPVFHLAQLVGFGMGLDGLGFERHIVSPKKLLQEGGYL